VKNRKLKSKKPEKLRSIGKQSGESGESDLQKKRKAKATAGKIAEKTDKY